MEDGDEGGDGGGDGGAGIGDLLAADGIGEGDDKAEKVNCGRGVVEAAEVVGGVDALGGRGLEGERGGEGGDFLGFGDGGEDDGLLGCEVVWREVDGGGADGAVGGGRGDVGAGWWFGWENGGAAAVDAAVSGGVRSWLGLLRWRRVLFVWFHWK